MDCICPTYKIEMKFERLGQIGSKSKAAIKTAATEREMDGGDFVFPVLL